MQELKRKEHVSYTKSIIIRLREGKSVKERAQCVLWVMSFVRGMVGGTEGGSTASKERTEGVVHLEHGFCTDTLTMICVQMRRAYAGLLPLKPREEIVEV